jgi:TusA-related sulfurtransferase
MPQITRESLLTLEAYAKARKDFRTEVMAHKKQRTVHLGEHLTLLFEDELTIRYQIQEILRVEKTFEEAAIQDELDAYNPLVPDGHNWKATLLIEYEDIGERKEALSSLKGVEDRVWVQVGTAPRVYAIADEDLERENDAKTSAVHFVRFEVTRPMVDNLNRGNALAIGVDHPAYTFTLREVAEDTRRALLGDLSHA